jgi:hypothetical protein
LKALIFGQTDKTIKPARRFEAAFQALPGAPAPVALADNTGCKWPIGDEPILFCGCATETGRYCPTHERMSGTRLPPIEV